MLYAAALAIIAVILWWAYRANELFCVSVRKGRLLLVRGRAPQSLLDGFRDVVTRGSINRASLRAYRDKGGARLSVSGVADAGYRQQFRNIFHLYPISQLRAAPQSKNRTIGQILGIAWLAWLFS
jgi:hypothetical protein